MLYKDSSLKDMSYAEWKKRKQEQEAQRTHNAEKIQPTDSIYDALSAIDKICFNGSIGYMPMYYIPTDLKNRQASGMYGYGCIMIDKPYYRAHKLDDDLLNTLFHEMAHAYCDKHHITDTDHEQHLQSFADVCNTYGADCMYDMQYGYSIVKIQPPYLKKIRAELEKARQ